MNFLRPTLIVAILATHSFMFSQTNMPEKDTGFTLGLSSGYNRGLGFNASLTALNPMEGLDGHLRFGLGYTRMDPGHSADARRIFINNATNGVPEKKGRTFDYRLDFLWSTDLFDLEESYFVAGPRYSSFRGNFKYIGGNEDFDVTAKQVGLGVGSETHFKINPRMDLVAAVGLDYFFNSTLKGHDTSYSPDNDNVNPRNDNANDDVEFTYKDANKSIKQPQVMPRLFLGVSYRL